MLTKVYKPRLKDGIKLAATSGIKGVYIDDVISKIRDSALKARMK